MGGDEMTGIDTKIGYAFEVICAVLAGMPADDQKLVIRAVEVRLGLAKLGDMRAAVAEEERPR
jgi:hypothetical protein